MKNKLALIVCVFSVCFCFSQQNKSTETDELIDGIFEENQALDSIIDSMAKYQFLYLTVNYNNRTYFSGRDIGVKQYNMSPRMTYLHHSGFYGSLSGIYYSQFDPKWDLTIATIGYGDNFGKNDRFKYAVSYSKYFYNNGLDNLFTNDLTFAVGVKNNKKNLGTTFSGTFLFGKEDSYQLSSNSYFLMKIYNTSKFKIAFKPQLNMVAGKQTVELARTYLRQGRVITEYNNKVVFSLLNTQLNFPLQFSTNSFDFEIGYNLNMPTAIGDETNLKKTSFVSASLSYLFDL